MDTADPGNHGALCHPAPSGPCQVQTDLGGRRKTAEDRDMGIFRLYKMIFLCPNRDILIKARYCSRLSPSLLHLQGQGTGGHEYSDI